MLVEVDDEARETLDDIFPIVQKSGRLDLLAKLEDLIRDMRTPVIADGYDDFEDLL